jgi:hypothetical protein
MFHAFLSGMLVLTSFMQSSDKMHLSVGPHYASYLLFQNEEEAKGKWNIGGEIGIIDFVPNLGLKLRGTTLRYDAPPEQGPYAYEYTPLTLVTSFNILPFVHWDWMRLSVETGFGLYFWRGLFEDEVIVLPTGDKMEERDIGFVGGLTLQLRPTKFIGLEYSTQYNYMASAEIYKYGFLDKDDKLWEHGMAVKILIPLAR